MYRWWLSALLPIVVITLAESSLPPADRSYKILMMLPVSTKSHRNVFLPLANALADRGHEVTMLSNYPLETKKFTHLLHGVPHFKPDEMDVFELEKDPDAKFKFFESVFPKVARDIYDDPIVKDLYARRKEFDLIIMHYMFNYAMYPFVHEQKFITVATAGLDPYTSSVMGNLLNPAYVPNTIDNYRHPYRFTDRVKNIFFHIMMPYFWKTSLHYPTQTEISKRFPDLPPILELEANTSLSLMNSHFSFGDALPLLPNQVEVGGMHCRPGKPLPKDLADFLSGDTPVVYMSLGSVARSEAMPQEYKDVFTTTFSKLPYKVLWKYEDESIKGLPKNVMISKWMPQQDVLAHPNVKVFITHCGGLGSQEAMYHATPMVGLPIFAEQPKNGKAMEFKGLGRRLDWKDLSVQVLTEAIDDVIQNPKYSEKISAVSAAFRDQLSNPVERAVYWTEYVIRHDGALHIRSPELQLSWIELLHIDVLVVFHLVLFAIYMTVKKILSLCFSGKKNRNQKKGKAKGD